MDWYTIEYLYPMGFKKFKEIMFPNVGLLSLNSLESYDMKKLYYFFDKEKIYLIVEMLKSDFWIYSISTTDIVFGPGNSELTREKVEESGFIECFRILENFLNE